MLQEWHDLYVRSGQDTRYSTNSNRHLQTETRNSSNKKKYDYHIMKESDTNRGNSNIKAN